MFTYMGGHGPYVMY